MTDQDILTLLFSAFADDPFPKISIGHITVVKRHDMDRVMAWPQDKSWMISIGYRTINRYVAAQTHVVIDFEHQGRDPIEDLVWLKLKV